MKKITSSIILLVVLLTSCADSVENNNSNTKTSKTEQVEKTTTSEVKEDLLPEGTEVEDDHRYDNLSKESTISDCYIVSHFTDMDLSYITVDFVDYKETVIEGDSEPGYELVNEVKTLRTFLVDKEYFDCGRNKKVSITKLIEKAEQDKETLFNIETDSGMVVELFVRNCAG